MAVFDNDLKVTRSRRNPTIISDDMLTLEEIRNEGTWSLNALLQETSDNDCALRWCARRQLIKNTMTCDNCQDFCTLAKYSKGVDGYRWNCPMCKKTKAVRDNSFFSRSRLQLKQILILIYIWCCDDSQQKMAREATIHERSAVDWCHLMRKECKHWLVDNYEGIGGTDDNGESIIVEIDESEFFQQKYHRGHYREGHWVFGGIERQSGKCFLVEVPDRTAKTLEASIKENILPGTHIFSDGRASFANINKIDMGVYQHSIVIHQQNFVDPDDSFVHTQNMENLWIRVKNKLKRQFGTDRKLLQSYMYEFMYRERFKENDLFQSFVITLVENYY